MSDFVYVPTKKAGDVDVVKPLKNALSIINSTSKKPQDFSNQIKQFSKLRAGALWKSQNKHEDALVDLSTYYDQLDALEKKFPAGELQIPFKWRDAFSHGPVLIKSKLTIASVGYEKTCILFNMAALQSYIGSQNQNTQDDKDLKLTAKMFQQSAGIFQYLKTNVMATLQQEPTLDLRPDTLDYLTALMVAQAQEVFVYKARLEKMKNEVIAKIANETSNLYDDVIKSTHKTIMPYNWGREMLATVSRKQAMFRGLAEYYQGLECKTKKLVGEHIARLTTAIEYLKAALKYPNKLTTATELLASAEKMLKDSIKENECIFHDIVPDVNSLSPIGRACLAKPQPVPQKFSNDFKDLFEELVPVAVQQMLISFENQKRETIHSEIFKLREATHFLNGVLASLNLPAAIEDSTDHEVPQSLVVKSTTVQNRGGLTAIIQILERLPELHNRSKEILEEIEKMLNEEEESDDKLRRVYKEKWTRKNSPRLTSSFKSNIEKYRRTMNSAIEADKTVRGKFEVHKIYIGILGDGPEAVTNAVPVPQEIIKTLDKDSQPAKLLKHLMEHVEKLKVNRDAIESELRSTNEDMKDKFISAINKGVLREEAILQDALERTLKHTQIKVKNSLTDQEGLIKDIQKANDDFLSERKDQDVAVREKEAIFKKLASAYDAFTDLSKNLEEGTKFYNDLTEVLSMFQSKVSDFCFARRTEKEELLRDLEKEANHNAKATTSQSSISNLHDREIGSTAQHALGPNAACSSSYDPPYPTLPLNMPMPYGSHIQFPYLQYYMPPMPNVYYPAPFPSGYQPPPLQDHPHTSNNENKPTS